MRATLEPRRYYANRFGRSFRNISGSPCAGCIHLLVCRLEGKIERVLIRRCAGERKCESVSAIYIWVIYRLRMWRGKETGIGCRFIWFAFYGCVGFCRRLYLLAFSASESYRATGNRERNRCVRDWLSVGLD